MSNSFKPELADNSIEESGNGGEGEGVLMLLVGLGKAMLHR
jgi:hypothetical protein